MYVLCLCVYGPDTVLAVFCTGLMMELLYTNYICKGLDVDSNLALMKGK